MKNMVPVVYSLCEPFSGDGVKEDCLDTYLENLKSVLKKNVVEFRKTHPAAVNIRFQLDLVPSEDPYSDKEHIQFAIIADRPMNEVELAKQQANEQQMIEYRRKQYEAMKKEFENK